MSNIITYEQLESAVGGGWLIIYDEAQAAAHPQRSFEYQRAEGFNTMFLEGSLDSTLQNVHAHHLSMLADNGVGKHSDGSYTLKWEDEQPVQTQDNNQIINKEQ